MHRDLKPDNVIVARTRSGKEVPKVVDFGIAKALSEAPQDALTRSGLVIGTPEYMSPEQLLGDPVDARADIYSLGCILYQMLTGARGVRRRHARADDPAPAARSVRRTCATWSRACRSRLDTLIVHMLARSPDDRLASAAEVRDQLDPALAIGGWDPRVITAPQPPRTTDDGLDESTAPTQPIPRQRMGTRSVVTGASMLVALAIAGVALYNTQQKRDRAATTAPKTTTDTTHAAAPPAAYRSTRFRPRGAESWSSRRARRSRSPPRLHTIRCLWFESRE